MVGHFQAIVSKDSASHVLFSNTQLNSQQQIPVHIIRQYVNHGGQAELLFIIVLHMKNSLQILKIATYLQSEYATNGCKYSSTSLSQYGIKDSYITPCLHCINSQLIGLH